MATEGGTFVSVTGGTIETAMPGTFVSAAGGTFETVMPGTFHSAAGGTFETVLGGTIKPLPSLVAQLPARPLRQEAMEHADGRGLSVGQILDQEEEPGEGVDDMTIT